MLTTDLVIIGAGPAGLFSAFEAGLLGLHSVLVDALDEAGGQCAALYPDKPIYDIPGIPSCTGAGLVQGLVAQIERFEPDFVLGQRADTLERSNGRWRVRTEHGTVIDAAAVVVAAGAGCFTPRTLTVANASDFEGKSLFYAVKDASAFRGQRVLVAGGGDAAVDWAIALEQIADRVTLLHRRDSFRAMHDSVERLRALVAQGRIDLVLGTVAGIDGQDGVINTVEVDTLAGGKTQIECDGLLAFFGLTNKLGPLAEWGIGVEGDRIGVDPSSMHTVIPGVYAVGDVADYPGKLRLILSGFAEAALMAHAAVAAIRGERPHMQYSTHNPVMTGSVVSPAPADIPVAPATAADVHLRVVDYAGVEHVIDASEGKSLLEVLQTQDMPVKGTCFGCCNCSTCHIYVDEEWLPKLEPMFEQEQDVLDQVVAPRANSRLACQIIFRPELSGMRITLSEDCIPE